MFFAGSLRQVYEALYSLTISQLDKKIMWNHSRVGACFLLFSLDSVVVLKRHFLKLGAVG